jgi:hypothetical protein
LAGGGRGVGLGGWGLAVGGRDGQNFGESLSSVSCSSVCSHASDGLARPRIGNIQISVTL